jgi:hypothetical protein
MNTPHLTDDQITDAYYGDFDASEHLAECQECRSSFQCTREVLDSLNQLAIPQREAGHGAAVWTALLPKLPERAPKWWLRWWVLTPALAAMLTIACVAGRLTEHGGAPVGISEQARERVLLLSLSDHLEQSQIVLANVANARPGSSDFANERDRAHELLGANRLLRQTAIRLDDPADAALLDELERVLMDVANSPDQPSKEALERTQEQIEQGLLFRVRVTAAASRERGQKL